MQSVELNQVAFTAGRSQAEITSLQTKLLDLRAR